MAPGELHCSFRYILGIVDTIQLVYINLFPGLRGFRITHVFSGTKMRAKLGLGVLEVD